MADGAKPAVAEMAAVDATAAVVAAAAVAVAVVGTGANILTGTEPSSVSAALLRDKAE